MLNLLLVVVALGCALYAVAQFMGPGPAWQRFSRRMLTALQAEHQVPADPPDGIRSSALATPSALAALLAIILCFAIVEAIHASGYSQALIPDYDEGAYTMSAQLLLAGYHLFSQVFSAQPAWFVGSLALGMRLLNRPGVTGGHLVEMMFGALALLGVAWIAWTSYGRLAALVAAAALAMSPTFLVLSHAVEAEIPMTGLGLIAIGAAICYAHSHRRWLLALGGLAFAASLEMKVLAAILLVPLALWIAIGLIRRLRHRQGIDAAVDLGTLAAAVLVPVLITWLLLAPRQQFDQVILFHFAAMRNMPLDVQANFDALRAFLDWDPALLALCVVGMLGGLLFQSWVTGAHLTWLGTTMAFQLTYHPLIQHQLLIVLPPAAVLAGGAVAGLRLRPRARYKVGWGVAALAIVAYGLQASTTWGRDRGIFFPTAPDSRSALAAFVAAHTSPRELVIADDLFVAIDAHRLVPPPLADPSSVRISAGYLTADQVIAVTQRYHVRVVVLWRGVYAGRLPDYITWLRQQGYQPLSTGIPGATVLALAG